MKVTNKALPILIILLAIASFLAGTFFTKIQYLEKGKPGLVQVTPTPGGGAAQPTPVILSQKQIEKLVNSGQATGEETAKITIVEFSDFQCPACGGAAPAAKQILSAYSGKIRLIFHHFPLQFHPLAKPAALASLCAADQNKFWEYHDKVFENQQKLSEDNLKQWAVDLMLNKSKFDSCYTSKKYEEQVNADYNLGTEVGIEGTPTFFVNGTMVQWNSKTEGWYNALKRYVDAELIK